MSSQYKITKYKQGNNPPKERVNRHNKCKSQLLRTSDTRTARKKLRIHSFMLQQIVSTMSQAINQACLKNIKGIGEEIDNRS